MNEIIIQRFQSYETTSTHQALEALREIIQEIALLGLWRGKFFDSAAFYGGTALRILYGLDRFSEDLDFTLLNPDTSFSISNFCDSVKQELSSFGFEVKVESKIKMNATDIASAFIKGESAIHLLKVRSNHKVAKGHLLQIKFEVDITPALGFNTENKQFFWPHPFSIVTCDRPSLLAGKLHATFCRQRTHNVKGRDFFDLLWFVGQKTKPNYLYLENKLRQTGHWTQASFSREEFLSWAKSKLRNIDISAAKLDIQRFIKDPKILENWTQDLFEAALDQF